MSLLDEYMVACIEQVNTDSADGEGGTISAWADGEAFSAAITLNASNEVTRGEKKDLQRLYSVMTETKALGYHDVFKRLSDGQIFRVTSEGADKLTPDRASFVARQVTAEKWVLT